MLSIREKAEEIFDIARKTEKIYGGVELIEDILYQIYEMGRMGYLINYTKHHKEDK